MGALMGENFWANRGKCVLLKLSGIFNSAIKKMSLPNQWQCESRYRLIFLCNTHTLCHLPVLAAFLIFRTILLRRQQLPWTILTAMNIHAFRERDENFRERYNPNRLLIKRRASLFLSL